MTSPITTVCCAILTQPSLVMLPSRRSVSTNTSEAIEFPTTLPVMESFPRHSILPMIVPITSSEQSEIMLPLMVVPFVIRVVPSCCIRSVSASLPSVFSCGAGSSVEVSASSNRLSSSSAKRLSRISALTWSSSSLNKDPSFPSSVTSALSSATLLL